MNTFEFADRFGYEPPFGIKEDKIEHVDGNSTNVKNVIVRTGIKFVYSTKAYEDAFGLPLQYPNYILIFAKKPRKLKIIKDKRTVSRLSHSGITFKDIINVYGITLGKNLVIAIEKDKNKAKEIANHVLKWLEISERTHSNFYRILVEMINDFVIAHPSKSYKQITSFDEFMNLLSLCIQLGVIDISNMAGFISDEIFAAFAKKIRETKLTEERWNPNIANIKYYPNIKSGKEYNPLIPTLDKLTSTVSLFFNEGKNQSFTNEIKTQQGLSKKQLETISLINSKSIFVIKQLYDEFGKFLISSLENINEHLKLNNAFIVGLINGIIELIATIVEAIGFVIGLLNYDKVTKLGESIKQAIAQLEWKTIKITIKNELQKLFSFLDDDNNYKNIYEFGLFIPKIIELILDTIGLVKGVSKVAKSVADIATELAEALKKANKALNDLKIHLALKIISKDLLKELKQKGITLEVRLIPASNLNAGIPIKMFDGKKIKVKYRNVDLFESLKESEVNKLLKDLSNNSEVLINLYKKKKKIQLEKSKNFKKHKQNIKNTRTKYDNNTSNINKDWNATNAIVKNNLDKSRAKFLNKYRKNKLKYANIATGKVKVFDKKGNLIFERNDYIKGSGAGKIPADKDFIHGSVDKEALFQNVKPEDFYDKKEKRFRAKDSENALLRDIEEDIILVADKKGIDIEELTIKIELESTYIPCTICKREILLRTQTLGKQTTIDVRYSVFNDDLGNIRGVKKHDEFNKYLNQ